MNKFDWTFANNFSHTVSVTSTIISISNYVWDLLGKPKYVAIGFDKETKKFAIKKEIEHNSFTIVVHTKATSHQINSRSLCLKMHEIVNKKINEKIVFAAEIEEIEEDYVILTLK